MTTFIIAILFFGLLAGVIYRKYKQYKKGETNCSGSCSQCPSEKSCSPSK